MSGSGAGPEDAVPSAVPAPHSGGETAPVMPTQADLDRVAVRTAPDPMIIVASNGCIVMENPRAREMFGLKDADQTLVGRPVDDLLPESLRSLHAKHRGTYNHHPRARQMGSGLELLGRRIDGTEVPVEVSLAPATIRGNHYIVAAIRDLTERRAAQASLHEANDRLALVAERERIGRDLHDSVIQRLYGAGLAMQAALDGNEQRLRTLVGIAVDEIDDTIAEIRSVIYDLVRDPMERVRLDIRVREVIDAQSRALGLPVTLRTAEASSVEPPVELADAVLAVIRECIANAHRHGRASHIDVDLRVGVDGWLRVEVCDDGHGFDPTVESPGYGLKNLRSRAVEFGGEFTVLPNGTTGMRVVWEVPFTERERD